MNGCSLTKIKHDIYNIFHTQLSMITVEWNVPIWVPEFVLFSLHNDTQLNQHTISSLIEAQCL